MKNRFAFILFILFSATMVCHAEKKALLIGIGKYMYQSGWKTIHGDEDIKLLSPKLEKQGFKVKTLINKEATKEAIIKAFEQLKDECKKGDKIYIHFSGHGQPVTDVNKDEDKGDTFDESMIPYDAHSIPKHGRYKGENHLIDDEYNTILAGIKEKVGKEGVIFMAIDACYSKGIERGEDDEVLEMIQDKDILESARGTNVVFELEETIPISETENIPLRQGGKLIVVSACKENERNFEYKTPSGKMYGSLSYCISELLRDGTDFEKWTKYFLNKRYRDTRIFQTVQHPTITIYR